MGKLLVIVGVDFSAIAITDTKTSSNKAAVTNDDSQKPAVEQK